MNVHNNQTTMILFSIAQRLLGINKDRQTNQANWEMMKDLGS